MKKLARPVFLALALGLLAAPMSPAEELGYCVTDAKGTHLTTEPACYSDGGDWIGPYLPPGG